MTKDADDGFLDTRYAPLEATRSAFRVHKRLLYHMCTHPETFLEPVTADLEAFETRLLDEQAEVEREAAALLGTGSAGEARAMLTRYTDARLLAALSLGESLVSRVERETRERFGVPMPDIEVPEGASWRPESDVMTQRSGQTYHRCFVEGLGSYPRRHGSLGGRATPGLLDPILPGP
jgi:uncharacterized protein YigA (DUF484 family)